MPKLCLYLQLHQPYRLTDFSIFDLSSDHSYFESENNQNEIIFKKVAAKSYLPMLSLLLKLCQRHPTFVFSLSCSGVFLEQAQAYQPEVITLLQLLAETGQVEFLAETYHHSLASLYSPLEFIRQVNEHHTLITSLFMQTPTVFRNTELIYSNAVAEQVSQLGFTAMLTEAVPRYLGDRHKTQLFRSKTATPLPLLLKHAELSDDVAFRFSDANWSHYPLHADTYLHWLSNYGRDELVNLFMDFETFGEHQWEETGIFDFFETIIGEVTTQPSSTFITPSMAVGSLHSSHVEKLPVYDVPEPISWADVNRDLTAWIENAYQQDTLAKIYSLEQQVVASKNKALLKDWRRLQTSDHFYYMCTKWAADGDVHAYFSPYRDPHEAYRQYSTVLADIMGRVSLLI